MNPFCAGILNMMLSLNSHVGRALSDGQLTQYAAKDSDFHFWLEGIMSEAADVVAV
jgi:hypothetical protein